MRVLPTFGSCRGTCSDQNVQYLLPVPAAVRVCSTSYFRYLVDLQFLLSAPAEPGSGQYLLSVPAGSAVLTFGTGWACSTYFRYRLSLQYLLSAPLGLQYLLSVPVGVDVGGWRSDGPLEAGGALLRRLGLHFLATAAAGRRRRRVVEEVPDQDTVVVRAADDLELVKLQPEHAARVLLRVTGGGGGSNCSRNTRPVCS